eukprot:5218295-Prymnesium_polylepis.1
MPRASRRARRSVSRCTSARTARRRRSRRRRRRRGRSRRCLWGWASCWSRTARAPHTPLRTHTPCVTHTRARLEPAAWTTRLEPAGDRLPSRPPLAGLLNQSINQSINHPWAPLPRTHWGGDPGHAPCRAALLSQRLWA